MRLGLRWPMWLAVFRVVFDGPGQNAFAALALLQVLALLMGPALQHAVLFAHAADGGSVGVGHGFTSAASTASMAVGEPPTS